MNRDELVTQVIEGLYHSFGGDIARHNFRPGAELAISITAETCARIAEDSIGNCYDDAREIRTQLGEPNDR